MSAWNFLNGDGLLPLWVPVYFEEGLVKAITALSSILTTAVLFPLIPKALAPGRRWA